MPREQVELEVRHGLRSGTLTTWRTPSRHRLRPAGLVSEVPPGSAVGLGGGLDRGPGNPTNLARDQIS
jgi:hypothetical protein